MKRPALATNSVSANNLDYTNDLVVTGPTPDSDSVRSPAGDSGSKLALTVEERLMAFRLSPREDEVRKPHSLPAWRFCGYDKL
ncbi:hypothetical protein Trydic_g9546 [Trypoxylus dichotomus]